MTGRHYHPSLHECFKVMDGRVTYTLNGVEQTAEPGETVDIPAGTLHSFWNSSAGEGLIRFDVPPAGRFAALIKNGFSLAQDGKTDQTGKPGILQIALMAREFDDVIRYDMGPRVIQQMLFLVLTPFAKMQGLKGSYPEYLAWPASEVVPLESLDRTGL